MRMIFLGIAFMPVLVLLSWIWVGPLLIEFGMVVYEPTLGCTQSTPDGGMITHGPCGTKPTLFQRITGPVIELCGVYFNVPFLALRKISTWEAPGAVLWSLEILWCVAAGSLLNLLYIRFKIGIHG